MAFTFPTSGLSNGQVFVTPAGVAYTYNSTTNAWAPGFTRSQLVNQNFTATAGQTVFTVLGGYAAGIVDIYYRGSKLPATDFTATNGTTFTLLNPCESGDDVQIRSFAQFTLANMVQKNSVTGDTMNNVVIGGITPSAATFTQATVASMNGGSLAGFRNCVINGQFAIDQRTEGGNIVCGNGAGYFHDRWIASTSSAANSLTLYRSSTAMPTNAYTNSLSISTSTAVTSFAAGDVYQILQRIEGANCGYLNQRTMTLSFWVYSTLAGTYGAAITAAPSSGSNYSYVVPYTLLASTWTYITVAIPVCPIVWNSAIGTIGLQVSFTLMTGTTYQTSTLNVWQSGNYLMPSSAVSTGTNFLSTTTNRTMYITGVQLEGGTIATPFEQRSFGQELILCQRYYEKSYNIGTKPGTVTVIGSGEFSGAATTGAVIMPVYFKAAKMTAPTMVPYSSNSGNAGVCYYNGGDGTSTIQNAGTSGVSIGLSNAGAASIIYYFVHYTAAAEL